MKLEAKIAYQEMCDYYIIYGKMVELKEGKKLKEIVEELSVSEELRKDLKQNPCEPGGY